MLSPTEVPHTPPRSTHGATNLYRSKTSVHAAPTHSQSSTIEDLTAQLKIKEEEATLAARAGVELLKVVEELKRGIQQASGGSPLPARFATAPRPSPPSKMRDRLFQTPTPNPHLLVSDEELEEQVQSHREKIMFEKWKRQEKELQKLRNIEEDCWRLENELKEKDTRINNISNQCLHATRKLRILEVENAQLNETIQSKEKEIAQLQTQLQAAREAANKRSRIPSNSTSDTSSHIQTASTAPNLPPPPPLFIGSLSTQSTRKRTHSSPAPPASPNQSISPMVRHIQELEQTIARLQEQVEHASTGEISRALSNDLAYCQNETQTDDNLNASQIVGESNAPLALQIARSVPIFMASTSSTTPPPIRNTSSPQPRSPLSESVIVNELSGEQKLSEISKLPSFSTIPRMLSSEAIEYVSQMNKANAIEHNLDSCGTLRTSRSTGALSNSGIVYTSLVSGLWLYKLPLKGGNAKKANLRFFTLSPGGDNLSWSRSCPPSLQQALMPMQGKVTKVKQGLAQVKVKKMFNLKGVTGVSENDFLVRNSSGKSIRVRSRNDEEASIFRNDLIALITP